MPDYSTAQRFKQLGYPVSLRRAARRKGQALLDQSWSGSDRVYLGATGVVSGVWVLKRVLSQGGNPRALKKLNHLNCRRKGEVCK